jgi:O-antigen/teichoic acid export membrane protein
VADPASTRARLAARNPLPQGTLAVGVGLVVAGITSYGFLSVAKHALGTDAYAPLALLWTLVFLLGPGFFLPVEQEVSRALAERRAKGLGGGPLVKRAAMLAGGLLAIVLAVTLALSPALIDKFFSIKIGGRPADHQPLLLLGLVLALVGVSAGHLSRGTCSGQGRFRPYAMFLAVDGLVRMGIAVVLSVAGVHSPGPYGLAIGISPIIAVLVAMAPERGLLVDGPPAGWKEVSTALGVLLAGSILSFTLVNGGPPAVNILGDNTEKAGAGTFLNAVLIGRIPLFLFQAVQAALLPRLSALASAGQLDEFRTGIKRLLVVTGVLGIGAAAGSWLLGPFIVKTMFKDVVDHRTLGLLGIGCGAYMVALALAQAVIALGGHRLVAVAWGVGVAAFLVVTAVGGHELFFRVELGLAAGSLASVVAMAVALRSRLRAGAVLDEGSIVEALHQMPFEA